MSTVQCREPKTGQQKVQLSSRTKNFAHPGILINFYQWVKERKEHLVYLPKISLISGITETGITLVQFPRQGWWLSPVTILREDKDTLMVPA